MAASIRRADITEKMFFNIIIIIIKLLWHLNPRRPELRSATKPVIIFKGRGHTGVIISFKGPPTI